jgi:hypothetical protein
MMTNTDASMTSIADANTVAADLTLDYNVALLHVTVERVDTLEADISSLRIGGTFSDGCFGGLLHSSADYAEWFPLQPGEVDHVHVYPAFSPRFSLDSSSSFPRPSPISEHKFHFYPTQTAELGDVVEVSGRHISRTVSGHGRIFVVSSDPQRPVGNLPLLANGKLDVPREKLGRAVALLGQVNLLYDFLRSPFAQITPIPFLPILSSHFSCESLAQFAPIPFASILSSLHHPYFPQVPVRVLGPVTENAKLVPSGLNDGTAHALLPGQTSTAVFATAMEPNDGTCASVTALLAPQACNVRSAAEITMEGLLELVATGRRANEMDSVHARLQEEIRLMTVEKVNKEKDTLQHKAEAEAACARLKGEVRMLEEKKTEFEKLVHQRDVDALDNCLHIDRLQKELQVAKGVCAQLQDEVQMLTTSNARLVDKAELGAMKVQRKNEQLRLKPQSAEEEEELRIRQRNTKVTFKVTRKSTKAKAPGFVVTRKETQVGCGFEGIEMILQHLNLTKWLHLFQREYVYYSDLHMMPADDRLKLLHFMHATKALGHMVRRS